MKILVFSSLTFKKHAGPTYSVPNQVKSLKKISDLLWINISNFETPINYKDLVIGYKESEINEVFKHITNDIDFVIFEEFHKPVYLKIFKCLKKRSIKYTIVPRGQMTREYNKNKPIKKFFGNLLFFNKFKKNACYIQFLTQQEQIDSKDSKIKDSYVIPNGIDIPNFRKQILTKERIVFTFIGRYSIFQKGIDFLFDGLSKIDVSSDLYEFNFYGPDCPSGNKRDVEMCAEKYGISDKVKINGPIFDLEKEKVLLNTDVFVLTSRFEGLPMSVLEALSYGIPVLVTKGTNIGEDVEKFDAGWFASSNDDISNFLINIIKNKDNINVLEKKSKNAVKMAEHYSWNSIAKNTIQIINDVLDR